MDKLIQLIPSYDGVYYEPFLGGGSFFFALEPHKAKISDLNAWLIDTYKCVKESPKEIITQLSKWPNNRENYYKIRRASYKDPVRRASQFLYLNKTCWNGLFRVNKQGKFNVPFSDNGRKTYDQHNIMLASKALQVAELSTNDFQKVVSEAQEGDLIYFDPPYTVLHSDNGFKRYNEIYYSWDDQLRLAATALELTNNGCIVIVSNADHENVKNLYASLNYYQINRHSTLASNPNARRRTTEALFTSFEIPDGGLGSIR